MHIKEYIHEKQRHLAKASRQIKDFKVFDFNYMPPEPLMRQELRPVIDAMLRYATTGIANHLCIFGSRGSGKTLLVRHISNLLKNKHDVRFIYANCRHYNTSFKILAHLLQVRPRGTSLNELWQRFLDTCPGKTVFILDEVDLLSDKDRNKDILYLISRSSCNHMAVLLSNNPRFLGSIDPSIRSTLQPEMIHFGNYNAKEIQKILNNRARTGIAKPPYNRIPEIAAFTVRNTNSDVRVAIKTLYYLALEPQAETKILFNRARRDIVQDVLSDLNDRNLLILKSAIASQEESPLVKAVYSRYRKISRQMHTEPFSYVYFYSNLSYLQSIGLVLLVSTKVKRTYTNRIRILFHPGMFESVWNVRFG